MDFANFEEFCKALGRLYDSTLQNSEDIRELQGSIRAQQDSFRELRGSTEAISVAADRLLSAVEKHQQVVESHERRLDRVEITVEAILEDLRRHREGRAPH